MVTQEVFMRQMGSRALILSFTGLAPLLACGGPIEEGALVEAESAIKTASIETVTPFNPLLAELPQGATLLPDGSKLVSFSPTGIVARVSDEGVSPYAAFSTFPSPNLFAAGLAVARNGTIYYAVGALGGVDSNPPAGLYTIDPGAVAEGEVRTPQLVAAIPGAFLNGIVVLHDDRVLIADSNGLIRAYDPNHGVLSVWSDDPNLAGNAIACGGSFFGFPIGANDMTATRGAVFVTNFDRGAILRIPFRGWEAGPAEVMFESCNMHGADGIVGGSGGFVVAANLTDSIVTVLPRPYAAGYEMRTLLSGAPVASPTALLTSVAGGRRLIVANAAYAQFFAAAAGFPVIPHPSVLTLTLDSR
jgi:hypothetical protein